MTKTRLVAAVALAVALLVPAAARAHEGHAHNALGTVASIQGTHVEVKTTDGKSVTVMLDSKTTVTRGKAKLDAAVLKVGDRVSVDYVEDKKMFMAKSIKLGTAAPATK